MHRLDITYSRVQKTF